MLLYRAWLVLLDAVYCTLDLYFIHALIKPLMLSTYLRSLSDFVLTMLQGLTMFCQKALQ